jgi:enamine deaminase RidA (YjgF/YER057c/UK114 family)
MGFDARLQQLGIVLPQPPAAGGNYVPAKTVGDMVYLSGSPSMEDGVIVAGKAGVDCGVDEGYHAARCCALTQLAILKRHLGTLDAVAEIVSARGWVNCAPDFTDIPKVTNGASDLLVEIFGESGRHTRVSLGANALPRNALVELQLLARIA